MSVDSAAQITDLLYGHVEIKSFGYPGWTCRRLHEANLSSTNVRTRLSTRHSRCQEVSIFGLKGMRLSDNYYLSDWWSLENFRYLTTHPLRVKSWGSNWHKPSLSLPIRPIAGQKFPPAWGFPIYPSPSSRHCDTRRSLLNFIDAGATIWPKNRNRCWMAIQIQGSARRESSQLRNICNLSLSPRKFRLSQCQWQMQRIFFTDIGLMNREITSYKIGDIRFRCSSISRSLAPEIIEKQYPLMTELRALSHSPRGVRHRESFQLYLLNKFTPIHCNRLKEVLSTPCSTLKKHKVIG
jgi:hypothetical protein